VIEGVPDARSSPDSPASHRRFIEKQGLKVVLLSDSDKKVMRKYGVSGAVMVLLPAAWPYPRLNHWRTLIQARAIENQLFVVACNRVGFLGQNEFFGHSMAVDPSGVILLEGGEEEDLLTTSVDLERIDEVRSLFNVYEDRQPEIY